MIVSEGFIGRAFKLSINFDTRGLVPDLAKLNE